MQERMVAHYRIIECLGGGAMGKVYKAEDTVLHRPVALKFLPAPLTDDDEASKRFLLEARATSSLDHPNICTIHEISQAPDGSWYIAMAWYEGQTLKSLLKDGPLAPEQALRYARQIALGLAQAHDQDVVHRDIKPANIIVTEQGVVKVLDFGLARFLGKARLTRTGTVMGTAAYMSPEQARGEDVGTSSDIWSLGAVLYELLAGRTPFAGESDVAMIYSVLNVDPPPLPEPVCRDGEICGSIINNCLARDPADRYPSARILAEDIEAALEGTKSSYDSKPSGSSVFQPLERRHWLRLLPLLVALFLLIAMALPQSRGFLRSTFPFIFGGEKTGVAVIPFRLAGEDENAAAFIRGLGVSINDRLSGLEQHSGKFWVVPADEIKRRKIVDVSAARTSQGVEQVVTGTGSLSGNTITLELTVHGDPDVAPQSREFSDSVGNLKSWQSDLLAWLTSVIDPKLAKASDRFSGPQFTNIPGSFVAFQNGMGHLVEATGGPDDPHTRAALSYLEKAVARDSSFACAWTQLGRAVFLRYGTTDSVRTAEAVTYLTTAARLDSTAVWPHYYLGNLKAGRSDSLSIEQAMAEYRRALALDPLNSPTLSRLGSLQFRYSRFKGAKETFYRAIDAHPRFPRVYRDAGVFHWYRAEYEKMRENFQTMVELVPDDHLGYYLLGAAYFEEGNYAEAETLFVRSLEIEPTPNCYENLGTLYYYDQRYIDSIDMCRKALEMSPGRYSAWRTLAEASRFAPGFADSVQPAYDKAMEILQIQLSQDPDDPHFMADHASFSAILGHPEKALAILAELEVWRSELDPEIMFSMASTYEELGDRGRALDWLETAVAKALSFKKVDHYPVLMNLRSDPRYIALRKKYGE